MFRQDLTAQSGSSLQRARLKCAAGVTLTALLLASCTGSNDQDLGLDIRPILPTSASVSDGEISTLVPDALFWNAMATEGTTAGMHDGYQLCINPDLGVSVFDIDYYGTLVNPAFDAGYKAGSAAIADSCTALTEDRLATDDGSRDATDRHRAATVGANYDTLDSHPDFGKGFDVGDAVGRSVDCDRWKLINAEPPPRWRSEYPSEFQSGYAAGLSAVTLGCAKPSS